MNHAVANMFKEAGIIERYGSGIARIRRICREYGIAEPRLEEFQHGFRVTVHKQRLTAAGDVTPPVTPPVIALLEVLARKGASGNAEIRAHLKLKDRAHLRMYYTAPALAQGWIDYTIPGNPTSRLQKYRLTETGLNVLAEHSQIEL